jgi:beta-xylosidase
MFLRSSVLSLLATASAVVGLPPKYGTPNNTLTDYTNPMIPGYRPDPSCIAVDGFFYCISSTFNNFPGLPIYASRDLQNWRHVSNVVYSEEQIPEYDKTVGMQRGIYAPTLRHHDGTFYVIVTFMPLSEEEPFHLIFNTTDPKVPESWSIEPVRWINEDIGSFDPDLFWDDDGQAYVTCHDFDIVGDNIYPIDVTTGEYGPNTNLWNGTGGVWPEGPHMYRKDDYYYLVLAEGGTSFEHMVTIARSKELLGPYEAYENNPIQTNANTSQYFQSVGHADFFQDFSGNWWGIALSIRQGPPNNTNSYPMGRETVLYPVTWPENGWPQAEPVRGHMRGPLPPPSRDVPGDGPWVEDGDDYGFQGDSLPLHFMHFRFPPEDMYSISEDGLLVNPSFYNLTGDESFEPSDRLSYVGRRQTDTFFTYFVDIEYEPETEGEEAGVTLFANQWQHADLGLVLLDGKLQARLRSTAFGADNTTIDSAGSETIVDVPEDLVGETIRLQIQAASDTEFEFSFGAACEDGDLELVGTISGALTSGANAQFTGMLTFIESLLSICSKQADHSQEPP